ncbi:hypothetical protein [Faecalibaculum rodentium]|jgi:hypothetical protein|nr:hypothetical protein [Faecalibaculum rodentium]
MLERLYGASCQDIIDEYRDILYDPMPKDTDLIDSLVHQVIDRNYTYSPDKWETCWDEYQPYLEGIIFAGMDDKEALQKELDSCFVEDYLYEHSRKGSDS